MDTKTINYWYDVPFDYACIAAITTIYTSFYDKDGAFIGVANFSKYFTTPTLVQSLQNTVWVSGATTIIAVILAFAYAYAMRSYECIWKACISIHRVVTIVRTNDDAWYRTYIFIW